jgi:hypothetical protein
VQPVCLVELTTKQNRHAECLRGARPKGRLEGSAIDDYVVEDHADHGARDLQNTTGGNRVG